MLPPPRCESLCWRREDFYFEVGALGDGFTQVEVEVIGMQIERGRREVFMNLGFESDCFCPSLDDDLGEHNFSTPGKQYPLDTEVSNFKFTKKMSLRDICADGRQFFSLCVATMPAHCGL